MIQQVTESSQETIQLRLPTWNNCLGHAAVAIASVAPRFQLPQHRGTCCETGRSLLIVKADWTWWTHRSYFMINVMLQKYQKTVGNIYIIYYIQNNHDIFFLFIYINVYMVSGKKHVKNKLIIYNIDIYIYILYVCMYVCMYVGTYVRTYVCVYMGPVKAKEKIHRSCGWASPAKSLWTLFCFWISECLLFWYIFFTDDDNLSPAQDF